MEVLFRIRPPFFQYYCIMESEGNELQLPQLSNEAIRVLGVLIEKSKTTPDNYPLTLNSLLLGCNQKSSRFPVVDYDENTVFEALQELKKRGLSQTILGDGRTAKYRHSLGVDHSIDPMEASILCLLFLRGPLTAGEIRSNSGRLYEFDSLQEVQEAMDQLVDSEPSFLSKLEKQAGKKEARYVHNFAQYDEMEKSLNVYENHSNPLKDRVEELEQKVNSLEEKLMILWNELKD
jgi:uncharacterized protein